MASLSCSTRFFITPMRSSKLRCIEVICCCSCSTWVCSWTISLLTPQAGAAASQSTNSHARTVTTRLRFIEDSLASEYKLNTDPLNPALDELSIPQVARIRHENRCRGNRRCTGEGAQLSVASVARRRRAVTFLPEPGGGGAPASPRSPPATPTPSW